MMESAASQLNELAQSLQARVDAKEAEEAAKAGGPKLALRFHPQAWQNDYAIEVDPEGKTDFQVPLYDVDLGGNGALPDDDQYESDELRHHALAPKWIQDWSGPFYIEITNRDELEAHLEGQGVKPKTPKPLKNIKKPDMPINKIIFKWILRWAILSAVLDAGLVMMFGLNDYLATEWWKSLAIALLVMPLWLGFSKVLGKSSDKS